MIAAYLDEVIGDGDLGVLMKSLRNVLRVIGCRLAVVPAAVKKGGKRPRRRCATWLLA